MTLTKAVRAGLAAAPLAMFAFGSAAHAQTTLAQFNFNTSLTAPSSGSQTASFAAVGTTTSSVSGVGSSDPTSGTNNALNSTVYPAQGTGSLTAGVRANVSTLGFQNIVFSFDSRASGTASRFVGVRYTLDGTNFITYTGTTTTTGTAGAGGTRTDGLFEFFNNDTNFLLGRTIDFTGIAGVANNANFGVQVLSVFAPGTSAYTAAVNTNTYGTTGTIRYDQVTFTGTAIGGATVTAPEPASIALLGMGVLGLVARRRRK